MQTMCGDDLNGCAFVILSSLRERVSGPIDEDVTVPLVNHERDGISVTVDYADDGAVEAVQILSNRVTANAHGRPMEVTITRIREDFYEIESHGAKGGGRWPTVWDIVPLSVRQAFANIVDHDGFVTDPGELDQVIDGIEEAFDYIALRYDTRFARDLLDRLAARHGYALRPDMERIGQAGMQCQANQDRLGDNFDRMVEKGTNPQRIVQGYQKLNTALDDELDAWEQEQWEQEEREEAFHDGDDEDDPDDGFEDDQTPGSAAGDSASGNRG